MSFFFDIWSRYGFILASDVKLQETENGVDTSGSLHKICDGASLGSKVNCAIAMCGEYPENPMRYFREACMAKDSLREIAQYFGTRWTDRYAGTEEYSAIHLVGFEIDNNTGVWGAAVGKFTVSLT